MYRILLVLVAALIVAVPTKAQSNLIVNWNFADGLNGWQVTNNYPVAPASGNAAHITPILEPNGSLRQTVQIIPNRRYTVRFYYGMVAGSGRVTVTNTTRLDNCDGLCPTTALVFPSAAYPNLSGYVTLNVRASNATSVFNSNVIFESWSTDAEFFITNVEYFCVDCQQPVAQPSATPYGSLPTATLPAAASSDGRLCLGGECGSLPFPVPAMPNLLSPTPFPQQQPDSQVTPAPGLNVDTDAQRMTPQVTDDSALFDGAIQVAETGQPRDIIGPDGVPVEDAIFVDFIDDSVLWIAYIKGVMEDRSGFGPFAPLVTVLIAVLLASFLMLTTEIGVKIFTVIGGLIVKIARFVLEMIRTIPGV